MASRSEAPIIVDKNQVYEKLSNYYNEKPKKKPFSRDKIQSIVKEILNAKKKSGRKDRREYFLLSTYDVITSGNQSFLIKKQDTENQIKYVVAYEDLYDKLYDFHVNITGHGGRIKMEAALNTKFSIPRPALEQFLTCCKMCNEKKQGNKNVRPIVSKDFNVWGQVDVLDFQAISDNKYNSDDILEASLNRKRKSGEMKEDATKRRHKERTDGSGKQSNTNLQRVNE